MGFNIYKEIPKIKEKLKENGFKKNIPIDVFGHTLMLMYGMRKDTVRKWIANFEELNIIRIKNEQVVFL